jgi:phage terminase small subunit
MAKKKNKDPLDELNLTEKNKIFCREYIFDWNATRSYKVAYPDINSDESAKAAASRLLTNVNVKEYIIEIQKDLEKLAGISRMKVISEHMKMAFSSIAHLHLTWITRKELDELTDDQKACIQEISTKTRTEFEFDPLNPEEKKPVEVEYVKIKLYDKQKSLDAINKMLGYDVATKIDLGLNVTQLPIINIRTKLNA